MSFRPTISVGADGKVVDWIIMSNVFGSSLLTEATFFAALLEDCSSAEEAARTLGLAYPVPDEPDDSEYPDVWDISEYPLCVDLDARAIYSAAGPLPPERVSRLEPIDDSSLRKLYVRELPLEGNECIPFSAIAFRSVREQPEYERFVAWVEERSEKISCQE